jgi:hypothetical protein
LVKLRHPLITTSQANSCIDISLLHEALVGKTSSSYLPLAIHGPLLLTVHRLHTFGSADTQWIGSPISTQPGRAHQARHGGEETVATTRWLAKSPRTSKRGSMDARHRTFQRLICSVFCEVQVGPQMSVVVVRSPHHSNLHRPHHLLSLNINFSHCSPWASRAHTSGSATPEPTCGSSAFCVSSSSSLPSSPSVSSHLASSRSFKKIHPANVAALPPPMAPSLEFWPLLFSTLLSL